MRLLLQLVATGIILLFATTSRAEDWTDTYDRLLEKYVTQSGVKYGEWKKNASDIQALQAVVDAIAKEDVSTKGRNQQLAFYLNAYNAWILHEALGKYPTASVKDVLFLFFISKRIKVAGEQTSFDSLEKNTIRSKFGEPRIHFALNCASRSCPPLSREAFTGEKLEQQLEKLAKDFVNSENGVNYSAGRRSAELSKIFDWYKEDFGGENAVLAFINKRRDIPIPSDARISYQEYDWRLNEAK